MKRSKTLVGEILMGLGIGVLFATFSFAGNFQISAKSYIIAGSFLLLSLAQITALGKNGS